MFVPLYFFLSLVPGGLVLWVSHRLEHSQPQTNASRRVLVFLLGIFVLLWIGLLALDNHTQASFLMLGFIPAMAGMIPITVLLWRGTPALHTRSVTVALGVYGALLIAGMIGYIQVKRDMFLPMLVYGGGFVIVLTWQAARGRSFGQWLARIVIGAAFVALIIDKLTGNLVQAAWPNEVRSLVGLWVGWVLPGVVIAFAGWLVYAAAEHLLSRRGMITRVGLLVLMVIPMIYSIAETAMLDTATDNLGVALLLMTTGVTALGVGLLLGWRLRRDRIRTMVIYLVGMTVALSALFAFVTRLDPQVVIVQRAGLIDDAIQRFEMDHGQYPASLTDLIPRDLLFLPNPILFQDQTWCYEGGPDYYRFGYIHWPHFDAPVDYITLRLVDSAGEAPAGTWVCDAQLADYRERYAGMPYPDQ